MILADFCYQDPFNEMDPADQNEMDPDQADQNEMDPDPADQNETDPDPKHCKKTVQSLLLTFVKGKIVLTLEQSFDLLIII